MDDNNDKPTQPRLQNKFMRHTSTLMWKCYLQRQRRWRLLAVETVFATVLFIGAVLFSRPVFLTPLEAEPEAPLTSKDLLASLRPNTVVGYAPDVEPYSTIMNQAAGLLNISLLSADSMEQLNVDLYRTYKMSSGLKEMSVIWVIWQPQVKNTWRVSIRSTERARYQTSSESDHTSHRNPHLRAGFLAVQVAVSEAIVYDSFGKVPDYTLKLVSMPVSPLMQEDQVKKALFGIVLCFTVALIPPVLDTQALVVQETMSKFKRGLRMRGVSYSSMYMGWLMYAYMTALPVCFVASVFMLLIFRWIHLFVALTLLLFYISAMIFTALIMGMFNSKIWIACVWSSLYTLLQTYMAELLVYHEYDVMHGALTFLLHLLMPPLGLVHAMNHFALLSTGKQGATTSLWYSFGSWSILIVIYFILLMILQSTIGHRRAIGGQVSWKSIIFKKVEDANELHAIEHPTGHERDNIQEVDELVAKAVSFRNVSKSIMGAKVLKNITMDMYRGEFTLLFSERVQRELIVTLEDLLTGLTFADHGSIYVLGTKLMPGVNVMTEPHMMGYCHRSTFLVEDLTVEEHFTLFNEICMWQESRLYLLQYGVLRSKQLMELCDLEHVKDQQIRHLDIYYRAQLCWAIAMIMEPRVVIVPNFSDQHPRHNLVIKDKIMQYKKYITLVEMCFSSMEFEYADRVFIFDSKVIAFGGTPAYMFFKYGREYTLRMTIRSDGSVESQSMKELILRAAEAGGTVRAHLGSLLKLRLPTEPTETVAKLLQDLTNNAEYYGMVSMHISVPDSEELYRRAMTESRKLIYSTAIDPNQTKNALMRMAGPLKWKRRETRFVNMAQINFVGWKYFAFHVHYRLYFIITLLSAVLAGIFIGLSLSSLLAEGVREGVTKDLLHGEVLTMELSKSITTLVLRAESQKNSLSLAAAYVLSEPDSKPSDVRHISYTALTQNESLTEYLVTRAIDSPQTYVSLYAYGMDVKTGESGALRVNALYSPLHKDYAAAARSIARVYTALLRHYTGILDSSIQVTDQPLALDLTPWTKDAAKPPLFVQFLLIMAISHITLLPSMENGFIRHTQIHGLNFSPARYWFTLFFWDLILYWLLVAIMSTFMLLMMHFVAPPGHFLYGDLLVVPFMLVLYGLACVPQAYIFSLGPRMALNAMTFIIVNIVFGETTIIAQTLWGDVLKYAVLLMSLSPQFNMAYAFVKIKQIFLYNSECLIFKTKHLCTGKILHKCCENCGLLQECFKKRQYLTSKPGILTEIIALCSLSVLYTAILLVVQYKTFILLWKWWSAPIEHPEPVAVHPGAQRERVEVEEKFEQIKEKRKGKFITYGEHLLAYNLTRKQLGVYTTHSVYLGVGRGEALAISGLKRHGRIELLELLAGCHLPDSGHAICMSKWKLTTDPHKYACQISLSTDRAPLPPWMTVHDALAMLALLRGVPKKHIRDELKNLIEALEIQEQAGTLICRITACADQIRLHFAAAVVGAPPVIILDECTAYQKFSVRRSMYCILHYMRRRGHSIITAASSVEPHMPMTNRLAILLDGTVYDVDNVDNLVARYSTPGYTVVLHLKDEVDVKALFAKHFQNFVINDTSEKEVVVSRWLDGTAYNVDSLVVRCSTPGYTVVLHLKDDVDFRALFAKHFQNFVINDTLEVLVNAQILDNLDWASIFAKMENLKKMNNQVYSYIVTAIPIDYIYNSIISTEKGYKIATDLVSGWRSRFKAKQVYIEPSQETMAALRPFEQRYQITKLKELPWSVIFQT